MKTKFNHKLIGLISDYHGIYTQATKIIQYLYWNKDIKVKELTLEKFVNGIDESYYVPTESGDIDYTISKQSGWKIKDINENILKCYEIINNKKDLFFDSDHKIYDTLQDDLRKDNKEIWLKSAIKNCNEKDNYIFIGFKNKEEQEYFKSFNGLLIELPLNNDLEFQQKYLKTILKEFNNL